MAILPEVARKLKVLTGKLRTKSVLVCHRNFWVKQKLACVRQRTPPRRWNFSPSGDAFRFLTPWIYRKSSFDLRLAAFLKISASRPVYFIGFIGKSWFFNNQYESMILNFDWSDNRGTKHGLVGFQTDQDLNQNWLRCKWRLTKRSKVDRFDHVVPFVLR